MPYLLNAGLVSASTDLVEETSIRRRRRGGEHKAHAILILK